MHDGSYREATFILPVGLTTAADGSVIVADAGAQRIRILSNGRVRTIAGYGDLNLGALTVAGGYADGPASIARFNAPSGVAVGLDRSIFIADTGNHCIRKLLANTVSTVAGTCGVAGANDGEASSARFTEPLQIAYYPKAAVLYVADHHAGLRKIDQQGNTTTVKTHSGEQVWGVSIVGDTLYCSDPGGFSEIDLTGKIAEKYFAQPWYGSPYSLAAIDPETVLYSDLTNNTIRIASSLTISDGGFAFGPPSPPNAFDFYGGYRDGTASIAQFNEPEGVTRSSNGTFLIADSLNHRIRQISVLPTRLPGNMLPDAIERMGKANGPRIAYIGDSMTGVNTASGESVAAHIEDELHARGVSDAHVTPFMFPGASASALASYIEDDLAGPANYVVLELSSISVTYSYASPSTIRESSASTWSPLLTTTLRDLNQEMKDRGVLLTIVLQPDSYDYWPLAAPALRDYVDATLHDLPWTWFYPQMLSAVKASGVDYIDLFPAFTREVAKPMLPPLFRSNDDHLALAGRQLSGQLIARGLKQRLRQLH